MTSGLVIGCARHRAVRLMFRAVSLCLAVAALVVAEPVKTCRADERPNIVFILADDLGYGDLGCYGRTDLETPCLDKMAREGVRLTAHYANGPECTPTRAAFLTGRYQQWIGGLECAIGTGNVGRYDDAIRLRETHDLGLPAEIPTLPAMLKKVGYETALFGKWHLGNEPKFAPHHHGFDQSYYCLGGEMDYFHYIDNVAGYNLFRDGKPIRDEGYFTDRITDHAVEFLAEPHGQPFFLYLPLTCPHSPFQGPGDRQPHPLPLDSPLWKQGKAPPQVYRAMIERMDACVGRIVDAVKARDPFFRPPADAGVTDRATADTLIVFTSDNGGTGSARNDPCRGIKGGTFEGGIRVPAIAWWPGRLRKGQTCDEPTLTFDWTRSFAELAGARFPESHALEGEDLITRLAEGTTIGPRTLYWRKPRGDQIWRGVRRGRWKYVAKQTGDREQASLFDLDQDPSETKDLSLAKPELAAELREGFDRWEERTRANRR